MTTSIMKDSLAKSIKALIELSDLVTQLEQGLATPDQVVISTRERVTYLANEILNIGLPSIEGIRPDLDYQSEYYLVGFNRNLNCVAVLKSSDPEEYTWLSCPAGITSAPEFTGLHKKQVADKIREYIERYGPDLSVSDYASRFLTEQPTGNAGKTADISVPKGTHTHALLSKGKVIAYINTELATKDVIDEFISFGYQVVPLDKSTT